MLQDRVDLQVAFVERRELFAYDGEPQLREDSIVKLVPTGTIGNGVFGLHADAIFFGDAVGFHYVGITKRDHHKTYRYDFEVPKETSRFALKHNSAWSIVGYSGSIWADCDTFDLVRIAIKVDKIPSGMGLRHVAENMRYGTVRIRDADVLLPGYAEIEVLDTAGIHSVDVINLNKCSQYTAESSVAFGKDLDTDSNNNRNSGH